jgi:transposase
MGRRNKNVAAVALANKNARIVWALLAHQRDYQADYEAAAASMPFSLARRSARARLQLHAEWYNAARNVLINKDKS